MNRRIRGRSTTTSATYLRYLKPGALAQLRDSKIKSRTQIYLNQALSALKQQQEVEEAVVNGEVNGGGAPCFAVRFYGPRCIQRKKMMAVRSNTCFVNPSGVVAEGLEPFIVVFSSDMLIAH